MNDTLKNSFTALALAGAVVAAGATSTGSFKYDIHDQDKDFQKISAIGDKIRGGDSLNLADVHETLRRATFLLENAVKAEPKHQKDAAYAGLAMYKILLDANPNLSMPVVKKFFSDEKAAGSPILKIMEGHSIYRGLDERASFSQKQEQGLDKNFTVAENFILNSPDLSRELMQVRERVDTAKVILASQLMPESELANPANPVMVMNVRTRAENFLLKLSSRLQENGINAAGTMSVDGHELAKLRCACSGGDIDLKKVADELTRNPQIMRDVQVNNEPATPAVDQQPRR